MEQNDGLRRDDHVVFKDNSILFHSEAFFRKFILSGDGCVFCGSLVGPFNEEHIVSRWFLKEFDQFEYEIKRPNGVPTKLSNLKIKMCCKCNDLAGRAIENPVSKLFKQISRNGLSVLSKKNIWMLTAWLHWTYAKFQIKSKNERKELDLRQPQEPLFEPPDVMQVYQAHALVRGIALDQVIAPSVGATIICRELQEIHPDDAPFSMGVCLHQPVIYLRIGKLFICSAIADSRLLSQMLNTGRHPFALPSNILQAQECYVSMIHAYARVIDMPQNHVHYRDGEDKYEVHRLVPNLKLNPFKHEDRDLLMKSEGNPP